MSNDISNFTISPAINNRSQYNACGAGAIDSSSQFNLGMYTSGPTNTAGFSLQGANGSDINSNPVVTTRLWINELSAEVPFIINTPQLTINNNLEMTGNITTSDTTGNLKNTSITPYQIEVRDEINGPLGDPIFTQITPNQIYMQSQNNTEETLTLSVPVINMTNTNTGFINNIAPDSITIQDTAGNNTLSLTPTTLTTNNGLIVNGLTTFSTCPQTPVIPTLPDDLVNLNYLQNNPPASAVIFYLNNSLTPSPPISTYALLGSQEDNLAQSSINTSISGIGTIQLIQSFSNQLINLNAGSFIPSGIWDLNVFSRAVLSSDIGHIKLYFAIFGRTIGGIETQISTNSSQVPVGSIVIEQLKMTLTVPYTSLSGYSSLVIKLYAINDRTGQTDITTYYEGTQTYSHLHSTFGIYVPPSLLGTNNTWTGVNTFSQQIVGSISGNATTSTSASTVSITDDNVNATNYLVFANNNTGNLGLKVDKTTNPLSYNPLTGVLNSTNFTGSLTGTASSSTNSNNTLTGTSNTALINLVGGVTKALTYQQLFMGNTLPLTYDTLSGLLTTQSLSYKEILRQSQSPVTGSTLNFTLGSLIIDTSTTASAFIFPIYTASNNGAEIVIQKTSAPNHNCVLTAGVGNQIASISANALGGTFTMTNNIYQQSFRFINPNWYPF